MNRKIILLSFIAIFACSSAFSQGNTGSIDYKTAVGLKFYPGAFSVKHFLTPKSAVEGLFSFWTQGSRITGLYELHGDINSIEGLKWYFGPGVHLSFFKSDYGGISPGVDGVIGLDYKFKNAPVNISLDWQPSIELGDYEKGRFVGDWGGLAIRYVF